MPRPSWLLRLVAVPALFVGLAANPSFGQAAPIWNGFVRCAIDIKGQGYVNHITHTWTLSGAVPPDGGMLDYPGTWSVSGEGSRQPTPANGSSATWRTQGSAPGVRMAIYVRQSDKQLIVFLRNAQLSAPNGTTGVQIPSRLEATRARSLPMSTTEYEWRPFPTIADVPTSTHITGSSATPINGRLDASQPPDAQGQVACAWDLVQGSRELSSGAASGGAAAAGVATAGGGAGAGAKIDAGEGAGAAAGGGASAAAAAGAAGAGGASAAGAGAPGAAGAGGASAAGAGAAGAAGAGGAPTAGAAGGATASGGAATTGGAASGAGPAAAGGATGASGAAAGGAASGGAVAQGSVAAAPATATNVPANDPVKPPRERTLPSGVLDALAALPVTSTSGAFSGPGRLKAGAQGTYVLKVLVSAPTTQNTYGSPGYSRSVTTTVAAHVVFESGEGETITRDASSSAPTQSMSATFTFQTAGTYTVSARATVTTTNTITTTTPNINPSTNQVVSTSSRTETQITTSSFNETVQQSVVP